MAFFNKALSHPRHFLLTTCAGPVTYFTTVSMALYFPISWQIGNLYRTVLLYFNQQILLLVILSFNNAENFNEHLARDALKELRGWKQWADKKIPTSQHRWAINNVASICANICIYWRPILCVESSHSKMFQHFTLRTQQQAFSACQVWNVSSTRQKRQQIVHRSAACTIW